MEQVCSLEVIDMPEMDIKALDRQLRSGKLSRVYFVYGTESYMKRQAVEKILDCCVDAEMADFNYQRFVGNDIDIEEVADAVVQLPMMSEYRCVLVEDLDIVRIGGNDFDRLCECINDVPESTVLVIWQNDVESPAKDKRVDRLARLCTKAGSTLRLDIPRTGDIAVNLCEKADEMGCRLNKNDAYYLIERCGRDMTTLYSELEKLAVYCGRKTISREAINLVCPPSVEADVFQISKAILLGKNDDAFKVAERLLAQRVNPIEIFSQLVGNFIDLYRAKAAAGASMAEDDLIAAFPDDYTERRRFRVTNALRDHSKYSLADIRRYIELLYNAELALKSGRIDRRTCIEQLIARLCAVKKEGRR